MAASKSVQESLAILEGVDSTRKRKREDAEDSERGHTATITDESNTAAIQAPNRLLNPASGPVRALPREEKILLGVPVITD
jgi:hypothetical protein